MKMVAKAMPILKPKARRAQERKTGSASALALKDPVAQIIFSAHQIGARVEALAKRINQDYENKNLVIVGILQGSFMFVGDLLRLITVPCEVDFLSVSSYAGQISTGMVKLNFDIATGVKGRDVLLLDDIVDTGFSLLFARKHILGKEPRSLETGVLLDKPHRRKVFVPVKYTGFTVGDHFVVGYGMDYNGRWRNLPFIGVLNPDYLAT